MFNKVVPLEHLLPTAINVASLIIKNAPIALTATINAVNERELNSLQSGLLKEQEEFSKLFNTEDTREGLSAFLEKRTPKYKGK